MKIPSCHKKLNENKTKGHLKFYLLKLKQK